MGRVHERSQSLVVAKISIDMFIIFRAVAGRQKLADRILVVLHDRVEQERGDSQVRQVIELGNHSSQVATPEATLIALAILEKTVAHDVIRGVTIEEFLDDHGIDDLILPAPCVGSDKRQGESSE